MGEVHFISSENTKSKGILCLKDKGHGIFLNGVKANWPLKNSFCHIAEIRIGSK
jgi:hypothetical protein